MTTETYESPIGQLRLAVHDGHLMMCDWVNSRRHSLHCIQMMAFPSEPTEGDEALMAETKKQLDEYFEGTRREFSIPLRPVCTDYQRRIWDELRTIPYGEFISYGELSLRTESFHRAIGMACAKNPISIFIPCHRIIKTQCLGDYAGGAKAKKFLYNLERR